MSAYKDDNDALTFIDRNTAILTLDRRLCERLEEGQPIDRSDPEMEEMLTQFLAALRQLTDLKLH